VEAEEPRGELAGGCRVERGRLTPQNVPGDRDIGHRVGCYPAALKASPERPKPSARIDPERPRGMDPAELLRYAVERRASDVHVKAGNVPFIRVDGELLPTPFPELSPTDARQFADALMPPHKADEFAKTREADFAYTMEGVGRFRVNVLRQSDTVGLAIRWVSPEDLTFEELQLPPLIGTLAETKRGLILVTGPTGAGKTTTIATLLGFINRTRRAHIVTIEDPIEVVFTDAMSVIRQREVGRDTESYGAALRQALRQDPDVIFLGEIRDAETALAAIQAAQTGHLVLSTMHTIDASETISRIVEMFPPAQQGQLRASVAGALRGVISQRLLERADGTGRVPAVEVMLNSGRIYDRILDPELEPSMHDVVAESRYDGMQTFDQSLLDLVADGLVTEEDARAVATSPHDFSLALAATVGAGSVADA
jgi:twitching motility protein PilT